MKKLIEIKQRNHLTNNLNEILNVLKNEKEMYGKLDNNILSIFAKSIDNPIAKEFVLNWLVGENGLEAYVMVKPCLNGYYEIVISEEEF